MKHKDKKHKKHSKQKKDKTKYASESDSDEPEWVEKSDKQVEESENKAVKVEESQNKTVQESPDRERDSWMDIITSSTYSNVKDLSKTKEKKDEETLKRLGLDKPGQHERELNPYWKDGGCGVPSAPSASSSSNSTATVGDGGLKWLLKAYQRAKEQAREEQRSLEDVVAERYGSLENLEKMIDEASKNTGKSNEDSSKYRRRHHDSPPHRSSSSYDRNYKDRRSERRFMAPNEDLSLNYSGPSSRSGSKSSAVPRWKKKVVEEEQQPRKYSPPQNVEQTFKPSVSDSPKERKHSEPEISDEDPQQQVMLTDKEMNELGAKIVKAEILGNMDLAKELKEKLEAAQKYKVENPHASQFSSRTSSKREEVILMRTNSKGLTRPLRRTEIAESETQGRKNKKQKMATHDKDGQRERYFADDDKYSLKQMFEREKLGTAEDQDEMFVRLAGKGVGKTSEDYDIDDALTSRANRVVNQAKLEEGERLKAITEFKKTSAALDRCRHCFNSKETPKHLIVAVGIKTYLSVPESVSLTDGHCVITPMQHVTASTHLDEDVLSEIKIFRKGLTAMFKDRDMDVVFFESCMNIRRYPHMVIHCVPLPNDVGSMAPMYFKKAILESETEWAHNKKLVELKQNNIQKSVPKGLPYFSVEFGMDGGFAHVIEDEDIFPPNFAQEIIGGMLDLDPNAWRRPLHQQFEDQRKKVLQLSEWWQPYDWTKRLQDSD
ncbi:hypothetical protein CHUAL_013541 [Chamberlinius hualienensis]